MVGLLRAELVWMTRRPILSSITLSFLTLSFVLNYLLPKQKWGQLQPYSCVSNRYSCVSNRFEPIELPKIIASSALPLAPPAVIDLSTMLHCRPTTNSSAPQTYKGRTPAAASQLEQLTTQGIPPKIPLNNPHICFYISPAFIHQEPWQKYLTQYLSRARQEIPCLREDPSQIRWTLPQVLPVPLIQTEP